LAYARGVEPDEPPRRPRDAGLAQPLAAPQRLLLAAPLAQAEEQRRDGARAAGGGPVAFDPQPGPGAPRSRAARRGAGGIAAGGCIGLRSGGVEPILHRPAVDFHVLGGCIV